MPSSKKKYTKEKLAKRIHRITPRKLAEAMPEVIDDLQSKNQERQEKAFVKVIEALAPPGKTVLTKDGVTMDKFEFQLMELAGLAVGDSNEDEKVLKAILKALIAFHYASLTKDSDEKFNMNVQKAKYQRAFDLAVRELKDDIVSISYQGSQEAFHSKCKAYNTTLDEFWRIFDESSFSKLDLVSTGEQLVMDKVVSAWVGLMHGGNASKHICWNCGKDGPMYCTQCRAAKYCSKGCQRAHWTAGHRHACKDMKLISSPFEEDKAIVDEAHHDPVAHAKKYGVEPAVADIFLLNTLANNLLFKCGVSKAVETSSLAITESCLDHILGTKVSNRPSMANFYNNVKRVVENGFYLSPGTPSMATSEKCIRHEEKFLSISMAMMFDYSRLPLDHQLSWFQKFATNSDGDDCQMTVAEWLYNYCDGERYLEHGPECKKFYRRQCQHSVDVNFNKFLRENITAKTFEDAKKSLREAGLVHGGRLASIYDAED